MNDKNIDDEFERIIAGFSEDSAPDPLEFRKDSKDEDAAGAEDVEQGSAEATHTAGEEPEEESEPVAQPDSNDSEPADVGEEVSEESDQPSDDSEHDSIDKAVGEFAEELNEELDEQLHLDGGKRSIGLVFAPLRPATGVARMLGMYGIARWIVPIADQVVLYLELDEDISSQDAEFESLLGENRPMPEEVDRFSRVMSKLSRFGAVAVVSSLQEEDSTIAGSIIARRYVNGEPEDQIPGGLLINSIDSRAEDLLLGRTHPSDYPDAIHPEERPRPNKRGFGRPFGLR